MNGAHAGKTGNAGPAWAEGTAGGAGGIVHILARNGFISANSISLRAGNSTNCANKDKAFPGFLLIKGLF